MSGKPSAGEIRIVLDEPVAKSKDVEKARMLYDVIDLHLPLLAVSPGCGEATKFHWIEFEQPLVGSQGRIHGCILQIREDPRL